MECRVKGVRKEDRGSNRVVRICRDRGTQTVEEQQAEARKSTLKMV